MFISRTVRIVASCALTALFAFGVAGALHDDGGAVRAADTTWSQPVNVDGAPGPVVSAMDTTW